MIAKAKERFKTSDAEFYHTDKVLFPASFTIISGTLDLKMNAQSERWWKWVQKTLITCWEHSNHGMAFNVLEKGRSKNQLPNLFYCTEEQVLEFCTTQFNADIHVTRPRGINDIHFFLRKRT